MIKQREVLVEKLNKLHIEENEIRKEIATIDYTERFSVAQKYEGKYYKEKNDFHSDSIRCLFVYDTDKETCEPKALCISYWKDRDDHFEIEYYSFFHPKKHDEEDKWIEITKEEFNNHRLEVMNKITNIVSK